MPEEMTVDPLYELNCWRAKIQTVSEFQRVINDEKSKDSYSSSAELQVARAYCSNLFLRFNGDVLIDSIARADSQSPHA